MQRYLPGLFDRLLDDRPHIAYAERDAHLRSRRLKDCIARDLEALLNTRGILDGPALAALPHVRASILNYGLTDFAALCLGSEEDRDRICAAVRQAIQRHEPRLAQPTATLRLNKGAINRIDLSITARLRASASAERMQFDVVLEPCSQHYSISNASFKPEGKP